MTALIPNWGRKTLYNGIAMRSRLEARVAMTFDNAGVDWEYEPIAFATYSGQYLPDFRIQLEDRTEYLELKGIITSAEALRSIQQRMEIIWSSEPDAVLMLWEGFPVQRQWIATKEVGWWAA